MRSTRFIADSEDGKAALFRFVDNLNSNQMSIIKIALDRDFTRFEEPVTVTLTVTFEGSPQLVAPWNKKGTI